MWELGTVQLTVCILIILFSKDYFIIWLGLCADIEHLMCTVTFWSMPIYLYISVLVSAHVCMWVSEQNVGQTSFRYSVSCANTACGWAESTWHLQKLTHTHKAHTHMRALSKKKRWKGALCTVHSSSLFASAICPPLGLVKLLQL